MTMMWLKSVSGVAVAALLLVACDKAAPAADADPAAVEALVEAEAAQTDEARAAERAKRDAHYEAALETAKASRGEGSPAIWTLKDDDTTLYILGTVHVLRPDFDWRSGAIGKALEEANTLVFEADTTSTEAGRSLMSFVSKNGLFQDGRQLTSLMSKAERAELEKALESVDLPLAAVQSMRPWFAAINLQNQKFTQDGFDPMAGVEMVLEEEARKAGKSFVYLETIDEQLGQFAGLADEDQVEFLIGTAEGIEEGSEVLDVLVDEWVDGDIVGLSALAATPEMWGSQATYDALLTVRNKRWVPKIEAMLDEPGTVLIAVGAAHLAGDDSVVTLLRNEGYEVTGP